MVPYFPLPFRFYFPEEPELKQCLRDHPLLQSNSSLGEATAEKIVEVAACRFSGRAVLGLGVSWGITHVVREVLPGKSGDQRNDLIGRVRFALADCALGIR